LKGKLVVRFLALSFAAFLKSGFLKFSTPYFSATEVAATAGKKIQRT
jgi:hypothetical protein